MEERKMGTSSVFYTWVKKALEEFNRLNGTDFTVDRNMLGEGKHPREPQVHVSSDGTIVLEYDDAPNVTFKGVMQPFQSWAQEKYMTSVSNEEPQSFQVVAQLQGENATEIKDILNKHGEKVALESLALWDDGNGYIVDSQPWNENDTVFETDEYVLSYNSDYVGLQRKLSKEAARTKTAQDDMFHPPAPQLNTSLEDDIPPMEWITDSDEKDEMSDEEKEDEKYEEINEQVDELEDEAIKKIEDEFGMNIKEDEDEELMEEVNELKEEQDEEEEDEEDEDEEDTGKRPSDFESSSMEVF